MTVSLDPDTQKLVDERVKSGKYANAKDVVAAAVRSLEQRERSGEFDPSEFDALLAEGEKSIESGGTLDGDEAYRARRQRRAQGRGRGQ